MSIKEKLPPQQPKISSEEEMACAFSGAAVLSNRFFVSLGETGLRIAFTEQYSPDKTPQFRTAVTLSFRDAINLYKVMQQQLKDPEAAFEKMVAVNNERAENSDSKSEDGTNKRRLH